MDTNVRVCSECFIDIVEHNKAIKHGDWDYCDKDCLDYRINLDLTYAWVVFKNMTDKYNNEPMDTDSWGVHTLRDSFIV